MKGSRVYVVDRIMYGEYLDTRGVKRQAIWSILIMNAYNINPQNQPIHHYQLYSGSGSGA